MKKILSFIAVILVAIVFGQGVGINNSNPQSTLDVDGKVRLESVKTEYQGVPLFLDQETKELSILDDSKGNFINRVNYKIYTGSGNALVKGFDTSISSEKYTPLFTSFYLTNDDYLSNEMNTYGVNHVSFWYKGNVGADICLGLVNNNWAIRMNYVNYDKGSVSNLKVSGKVNPNSFFWDVNTLFISNYLIKDLGTLHDSYQRTFSDSNQLTATTQAGGAVRGIIDDLILDPKAGKNVIVNVTNGFTYKTYTDNYLYKQSPY